MEVLIIPVFVSLMLVIGGVVLLAYSIKQSDHEHADRLSIMPLDDEQNQEPLFERKNLGTDTHHL